ncbi:UvrB/UvrC protein [Listeria floridensis FSL S10-1187]|uniref:UvrB/UvrC protein n=1 Tax=Listeria floridensis FSL S10-1187 TaxID=1265817 RepID=A0ABN0RCB9_9LIST|nr:UvrB/UvrC motif-containing protein [Listeria floridensis]EUJ26578.1 UvrB/UvrC protein [Listeria floridensis FSL S10-1187]
MKRLKKTSRVGCSDCYEVFGEQIVQIAKQVHGGNVKHVGKVPEQFVSEANRAEVVSGLREQIQKMIEIENFEEAAKLRDEIRAIEGKDGELG